MQCRNITQHVYKTINFLNFIFRSPYERTGAGSKCKSSLLLMNSMRVRNFVLQWDGNYTERANSIAGALSEW